MRYTEGRVGRVFILRLEHGDELPGCIEKFAAEKGIKHALVSIVGGIGAGSVVVGPRKSDELPADPVLLPIDGAHEAAGVGVIAPDEKGRPALHIHAALGRMGQTVTGCLRPGVSTWHLVEAVVYEIVGASAKRVKDARTGFALLEPENRP